MLGGGKTIAVPSGTAADQFVKKRFADAKVIYFNDVLDCAMAVKKGTASAAVYDKPVLENIAGKNDGLVVLTELLADDQYGFAFRMQDTLLKKGADEAISELKANGTYDDMMKRWFPKKGSPAPIPNVAPGSQKDVLIFGTAAVTEPISFRDANQGITGFDIELARFIAKKLNKRLEIIDMKFEAMIPALIAGKVDMIGAGLSITEERAKTVLFSQCYYKGGLAAIVKSGSEAAATQGVLKMRGVDDLKDKKIGVLMGSVHDSWATKQYPNAEILQFQNISDLINSLNNNKVDAILYDQVSAIEVLKKNPELGILAKDVFVVPIAAGFNKESTELRNQFNAFLAKIKSDGTYKNMVDRWVDRSVDSMPDIPVSSANGTLKNGVVSDIGMPFTIIKDGSLAGFDIELSKRFALSIGKEYVPVDMPFASLLASISSKKIDLITASMMVTEERKKRIDFSDPYYESGVSIIAQKSMIAGSENSLVKGEKISFFEKVSRSFYSNMIVEKRYMLILNGLLITIIISIFAAIFGSVFGGLICYLRMSKNKIFSGAALLYISLLRGTPVLVLLMIIYYVVFASVNINPVVVAIFAFGLNFAAYVSEMFRMSISSIEKGQWEAGIAGGFTKVQTFKNIIAPQALRQVLPVYKGEFISLVKMTSIVGYIAVQDLTKAGDIVRSRTFDAFFPLIMAAVIYLALAWILTRGLDYIEVSADPKRKRNNR